MNELFKSYTKKSLCKMRFVYSMRKDIVTTQLRHSVGFTDDGRSIYRTLNNSLHI